MFKILVADDDKIMLQMIEQVLDQEGYDVTTAEDGSEVLDLVKDNIYDLFLLDLTMERYDGITLCRQLRQISSTAQKPILFLTGQHEVEKAVKALEAGGDDYIRKPFAVKELTARLRAHLRRASLTSQTLPSLHINEHTFQVFIDNREIYLTRIEFELLRFMAHTPNKWHSAEDLLGNVWNYPPGVGDNALVRNHIRNLRRKLEPSPDYPSVLQSRHGKGYTVRAHIVFDERQQTQTV